MRSLTWLPVIVLCAAFVALAVMFAEGDEARMVAWYACCGALPIVGVASVLGAGARLLWKRRPTPALHATLLLGLIAAVPASWTLRIWPMAYPTSVATAGPGIAVRVPTDATMRVAWGGDDPARNQHAITADQRWAYDLVVAPYFHGSPELEAYGCFGVPVLAPIAGNVAVARDGLADLAPGEMDPEHALGNHVALEPEAGGFLILAHLQQGSVQVEAGQRVAEGTPLGKCGNSGNTSEPHVHIHYQRQHPSERPVNFADGLPLYFRDHGGPAMPRGGVTMREGKLVATGDEVKHGG